MAADTTAKVTQVDCEFEEVVFPSEVIEEPIVESPQAGTFVSGLNDTSGNNSHLGVEMTLKLTRDNDFTNTNLLASYFTRQMSGAVTDRVFAQARREKFTNNPALSVGI